MDYYAGFDVSEEATSVCVIVVGRDTAETVTDDYPGGGAFPGEIERLELELLGLPQAPARGA